MDSSFLSYETVFANDNRWDSQAAVMLGRFIALYRFRDRYKDSLHALAISPEFFFFAGKSHPQRK